MAGLLLIKTIKTGLTMRGVKNLRETLGVSQQSLANYLRVKRSTLAVAETNQRSLPQSAQPYFSRLERAVLTVQYVLPPPLFADLPTNNTPSSEALTIRVPINQVEAVQAAMQEHRFECLKTIARLTHKLAAMEAAAQSAVIQQKILEQLKQSPPTDEWLIKFEPLWITETEAEVNRALSTKHQVEIAQLKLRIAALQWETRQLVMKNDE
jgi:transcriptional regulator with XRE-family HTH domain